MLNIFTAMNPEKLLAAYVTGMSPEKKAEVYNRFNEGLTLARKTADDFETIKHQNDMILNRLDLLAGQLPPDEPITEQLATIEENTETLIDLEINGTVLSGEYGK